MKALVRFAIPFLVFASFFVTCSTSHGQQALAPTDVGRTSLTHVLQLRTIPKVIAADKIEYELKWQIAGEAYTQTSFANSSDSVYGVERHTPKGVIVFGRTERVLVWLRSQAQKVKVKGKLDFSRPYIIRKKKQKYIISQRKSREVDEMFAVLDDMLITTVVPNINKEPGAEPHYSKLERGEALTNPDLDRKFWK